MPEEPFQSFVSDKTVRACGILSDDMLCFSLEWTEPDGTETSSGHYFVHHLAGDESDFHIAFQGDRRRRIAVDHGAGELLMVAAGGNVLRHGPNGGGSERQLTRDQIVTPGNVRHIGRHFYVAGAFRRLLRREAVDAWTDVTSGLQSDEGCGFDDVDGFGEDDIYAAGGLADVWHFDGAGWHRLEVPVEASLRAVLCGSDGYVYLGGSGLTIVRGRGNEWEVTHRAETNQAFQQIVEFERRLYAVDDWGSTLYEVTDGEVRPADTGAHRFPYRGCYCLAADDEKLVVAGQGSASLFDGQSWRSLAGRPDWAY